MNDLKAIGCKSQQFLSRSCGQQNVVRKRIGRSAEESRHEEHRTQVLLDSVHAAFCETLDGMHIAELSPTTSEALLARHPEPQLHHASPSTRRGHIGE